MPGLTQERGLICVTPCRALTCAWAYARAWAYLCYPLQGIDVLHVYLGRPLCSLRLSPSHSAHADINGDGTIDHVHAIVNPGDGESGAIHKHMYIKCTCVCRASHGKDWYCTLGEERRRQGVRRREGQREGGAAGVWWLMPCAMMFCFAYA